MYIYSTNFCKLFCKFCFILDDQCQSKETFAQFCKIINRMNLTFPPPCWKISLQHVVSAIYDKKMNFYRFVFTNFCYRLITYWIINVKLIRLRTRKPKRYNKPHSSNGITAPILLKFKVMKTPEKATFNYSYGNSNFSAHLHSKQFKPVKTGVLHRNCYFYVFLKTFD